ncbi:efflux RND transporter permease subunit [Okibacterium fritillariae]|uniref:Hydrophobic/amphiphilic exporter-1, HAE1 family n=1 Tax=Okibacterium fritillariae TaxID=123320 RepID=A0A1T5KVV3_9MICO|nr:efflux RND transporter permease subunit [Okibacterium fritillariae]SKC67358.1 hydrophobic/amphiphilic exporter-1, HAE1 family [Okibacterium fritillariae]
MYSLAALSLTNKALIALATAVVALFGSLALGALKQELVPNVQFPQIVIVTAYPGATPEVVDDDVSAPIEAAIRGVPGLESSSATSSTDQSVVTATFAYGTDLAAAEQKLGQAINRIALELPEDVDPQVVSGSIDDLPVMQIAVTSGGDPSALSTRIRQTALVDIEDVAGVREAQLVGQTRQRVTITPDSAELARRGLTTQAVTDALAANGKLLPAGDVSDRSKTFTVQTGSTLASVDDIAALPLVAEGSQRSRAVVTVGDVAAVALGDDPRTSISRVDGKPALTIAVTKLPSANTVEVSRAVRALLPGLTTAIGSDAALTVVFDQAPFIEQSIETLAIEGLLGLVFAVLVILLFLVDVRATIVTAISIPVSVLITFIGLQAGGYTLNVLTLGALTIALGRVVDDSIVVIENIKRHLADDVRPRHGAAERSRAILSGVREVAGAITASTLTTVAVFLPLAFVGNITGELFRPFALTVTIALLASLLVALTIVPVLAFWFLRAPAAAASESPADDLEHPSRLQKAYLPIIRWTMAHSVSTLLLSALVLVGTFALTPLMKSNFLGDTGQNVITITQTLDAGASLQAQDDAAALVEAELAGVEGVASVQLSIGSSGSALRDAFAGGSPGAVTYSITTDEGVDQEGLRVAVRQRLEGIHGVGSFEVAGSGWGGSSNIEVDVTAVTSDDLVAANAAIVAALADVDSVTQVVSNLSATRPYVGVQIDRRQAAAAGYTEAALGALVAQATRPTAAGSVEIGGSSLKVFVQSDRPAATEAELAALEIPTATGPVRLDTLATVGLVEGPASLTSAQGARTATVSGIPADDNIAAVSARVQSAIDGAALPAGASATLGGITASQGDAFGDMGLALLVAILIVYIVMVATFRSLRQPLLLLVSVPFAATGAIALQVVTGIPLGVPSLIGVLMLIGVVVTNAIVLVDHVNQYRARGMSVARAVELGSARRLRPILMTALATILALTPMALGVTGHGGFISQPLAIVVIGGLLSSTVLTLVVLPTLYALVEGAAQRRAETSS